MSNAQTAFAPEFCDYPPHVSVAGDYADIRPPETDYGQELTAREATFLTERDGLFQATATEAAWPDVQFRGGQPGFIRIIDQRTIGFVERRSNRQAIGAGGPEQKDRVSIIAVDFARRRRLRLIGHVRTTDDADVVEFLNPLGVPDANLAVVVRIAAFDWSGSDDIPLRLTDGERHGELARLHARIRCLERNIDPLTTSACKMAR
ncbi:pyridoxamine 5'-phosphate oxidase family protein [Amaricoccus tamworthensis]|uniref:pyridoxamine 5'-phosphate oxidase family protein n=1 Tax=Amaricoccus tamworthensis TaxID=57002 RepID=UPI003C7DD5AA